MLSPEDANVRPDYVNGINPKAGIVFSVRSFDDDASLSTVPDWDSVTGSGSPNETYIESYGS